MMRYLTGMLALVLAACVTAPTTPIAAPPDTPEAAVQPTPLPSLGPAPELHNEVWLNVDAPIRLAEVRGQVVLLDMWTFG